MPSKKSEYSAITIDTSIFHKYGYRFYWGLLKSLRQFSKGPIQLVLSDIVLGEIKSHLIAQLSEAQRMVKRGAKDIIQFINPELPESKSLVDTYSKMDSPEQIASQIVNDFLRLCKVEIIHSSNYLNVDDLLTKYFAVSPPFSNKEKKKHEFPDAITLLSLDKWGISKNVKILAVSEDGDWEKYIKESSSLSLERDLGSALSLFQPILFQDEAFSYIKDALNTPTSDLYKEIDKLLSESIDNTSLYIEADSDFHYDYEIEQGYLVNFEAKNNENGEPALKIIEIDEKQISIECKIQYTFEIECNFNFSVYDSEDRDDFYIGGSKETRQFEIDTEIIVSGKIDDSSGEVIFEMQSIEISNLVDSLDFGYVGPNLGDDFYEYQEEY